MTGFRSQPADSAAARLPRVLLITDPQFGDDAIMRCVNAAACALPAFAFGVQLRDKARPAVSFRIFASRLRLATAARKAFLFVNGHPEIARDVGADGVHLGEGTGEVAAVRRVMMRSSAYVSRATHDDDGVRQASIAGADAVLVSPVFPSRASPVEPLKRARGLAAIRSARTFGAGLFIYALGGITAETAPACAEAGADGVAVIRALLASPRPDITARAIHDAFVRR